MVEPIPSYLVNFWNNVTNQINITDYFNTTSLDLYAIPSSQNIEYTSLNFTWEVSQIEEYMIVF